MSSHYVHWILDDQHHAQPVDDVIAWAQWFRDINNRGVARDVANGYTVSTVFLGIDYSFGGRKPLLFETAIFSQDSRLDLYCERYSTWAEAEAGHARILADVKAGLLPKKEEND